MTPPRVLPLAAWWHRVRLHVVHTHVIVADRNGQQRWHTYCATCAKGWS